MDGLAQLINATDGVYGDEGPALVAAVGAMTSGLAEWDAAIARVEARLNTDIARAPTQVAARMRTGLGTVYLERGRIEMALAQFSTAAGLDPSFAQVHVLRGLAYERAGRLDEAAAAYAAAFQRDPENGATAYLVLRTTRGSQPPAGPKGPALRDDGAKAAALRDAARNALLAAIERSGSNAGARGFLTTALLDDASVASPVFPPVAYSRGFDLIRQGKYDEALASFRASVNGDALVIDRAVEADAVRRGAAALRQQNPATAIASLEVAARENAVSSDVHRILGTAYAEAKQFERSIAEQRDAVRLNPRDERARLALADVLVASGNPAAAYESLRATTRDVPGSAEAYWKLGRLDQTRGNGADALRSFEQLTTLPIVLGAGRVYGIVGQAHHAQFDLQAAADAYARRVVLTPNDRDAHFDLGEVYRAQDELDDALAEYAVAALLEPTNATTFAMIGQVHVAAGRDEQAVPALRRAVSLDPSLLDARYGLSRALLRLGKVKEAQQELQTFEQAKAKSMEEERRRFLENQQKIDDVLKAR